MRRMKEDNIIRKMALVALISCLFLMLVQMGFSPKSPYPLTITRVEQVVQPIRQAAGEKPKPSEAAPQSSQGPNTATSKGSSAKRTFPMNIYEADKEALMQVKGIGEKRAEQILEYLRQHGPIQSLKQLGEIKGIGEVLLDNLSEKFYVGSPSAS